METTMILSTGAKGGGGYFIITYTIKEGGGLI